MSAPGNGSAPGLAAKGAQEAAWSLESEPKFSSIGTYIQRMRLWLARVLTGRDFFNREASLEIDRLTLEVERLRDQIGRPE